MRNIFINISIAIIILCSCKQEIKLENYQPKEMVHGEYLLTEKNKLQMTEGLSPLLLNNQNEAVLIQAVDTNGDKSADVLFYFTHADNHLLTLSFVQSGKTPQFPTRTNIRFAKKENDTVVEYTSAERLTGTETSNTSKYLQMEGPAWENDLVGFRNYFDERNGMDIFGKTTPDMVLDTIGLNTSYHEYHPWGMDILKVANSLGAGAIALLINDSIYRIGAQCQASLTINYEGPIASSISLVFDDVKILDRVYKINHEITIKAGKYAYDNKLTISGLMGDEKFVCGIVNLHSDTVYFENVNNENIVIFTHDKQAFDGEYLGMAVMTDMKNYHHYAQTAEEGSGITQTYYLAMNISNNTPLKYSFYAGWEKTNPDFANIEKFKELLSTDNKKNSQIKNITIQTK